jgi:hypothetical protein
VRLREGNTDQMSGCKKMIFWGVIYFRNKISGVNSNVVRGLRWREIDTRGRGLRVTAIAILSKVTEIMIEVKGSIKIDLMITDSRTSKGAGAKINKGVE